MEKSSGPQTRRTLRNIRRYLTPEQVHELIVNSKLWLYRTTPKLFHSRDRALLATLYLTAGRINEVLQINKSQFDFIDDDFIIIRDFEISKRKAMILQSEGIPKVDIPLPREGTMKPFTLLLMTYYAIGPEHLFNIGRRRAHQLCRHMTGKWCHWFRSQRLSYLMNTIKSETIVARMLGIKNPGTIRHYYKGEWEEHRDILLK